MICLIVCLLVLCYKLSTNNFNNYFRLRRSPRKQQQPSSPMNSLYATSTRKTPAKLFTPSGDDGWLVLVCFESSKVLLVFTTYNSLIKTFHRSKISSPKIRPCNLNILDFRFRWLSFRISGQVRPTSRSWSSEPRQVSCRRVERRWR